MSRTVSRKSSLVRFLDGLRWPVYLIDRSRKILFCSEALARISGKAVDQMVGAICGYHSESNVEDDWSGLCPPSSAFASDANTQGLVHLPTPSGPLTVQASFCPLVQGDVGDREVVGLLVVVHGMSAAADDLADRSAPLSIDAKQLHTQLWALRARLQSEFQIEALIGQSAAMNRVREQVRLAAETQASVLVMGPAGSGRERVARTIHACAASQNLTPLIPLAASVLDAELLRTTIEAFIKRCAELETDQAPTLLLLDADRMAEDAQGELMGFLAIEELGIRTLATATVPLIDLAAQGSFYPRLAHRLSILTITLPSLGERPEDIPLLAQYLVEQFNQRESTFLDGFAPQAMESLVAFPWSRNVEELKQTVEDGCRTSTGPVIELRDLPARIRLGSDAVLHPVTEPVPQNLAKHLEDVERSMIAQALKQSDGNKTLAAKMLSISRARLLRRIEQLNISTVTDVNSS